MSFQLSLNEISDEIVSQIKALGEKWVSPARPLLGWHFSRSLFIKMLTLAGFTNPRQINHPLALNDVEDNMPKSITNTGYFAADFAVAVNIKEKSEQFE